MSVTACVDREAALERHLARAGEYIEQGEYAKARVELKNVARLDPQQVEGRLLMGTVAERSQNWRNAYRHFLAASQIDPANVDAHVALAGLMLRFNEVDKAEESLQAALALDPEHAESLALQGWVAMKRGDRARAEQLVARVLAREPGNDTGLSLKSELLLAAGDATAAIDILELAVRREPQALLPRQLLVRALTRLGRPAQAIPHQQAVVSGAPDEIRHRVLLARLQLEAGEVEATGDTLAAAYDDLGDRDAALALADLVVSRFPQERIDPTLRTLGERYPDEAAFSLVLAAWHQRRGDAARARGVLQDLIARTDRLPAQLEARVQLARLHLMAGDREAARDELARVLDKNGRDVDALILRAQLARSEGRLEAAIADLRLALDAGERKAEVQRLLAQTHAGAGDLALAVSAMRAAVEAAPDDPDLRLTLAQLALRAGNLALARNQLDRLLDVGVDRPAVLELGFHVAEREGDADYAATLADRLVAHHPDEAVGYYLQGRALHLQQRFAAARAAYDAALARDAGYGPALDGAVRVSLALGEREQAMGYLEDSLAEDPADPQASMLLGEVLNYVSDEAGARETFSQIIAQHPTWWLPYARLAELQVAQQAADDAQATLSEGLAATAWHPQLAEALALLHLEAGRSEAAIGVFETLLERYPDLPAAANNLALLLASHRSDAASLTRAANLVEPFVDSRNPAFLDTVGWVRLKRGDTESAVAILERAVKAAPQRPTPRYHLALAYLENGDEPAARRELDVVLTSGQPFPEREDALLWRDRLREPQARLRR